MKSINEFLVLADFPLHRQPRRVRAPSYVVALLAKALRFNQLIRVNRYPKLTYLLLKLGQALCKLRCLIKGY